MQAEQATGPRSARRTSRALVHFVIVALASVWLASPAFADEVLPNPSTPEALAQLEEGNKLYMLREYEKAIAAYKEGVRLEPKATVTFWYNLGQAHRQWGKYEDAIWFYSQFLKAAPANLVLHRQAAEGFIAKMRGELDKAASTATPTEPGPSPLKGAEPSQPAPAVAAPSPADRTAPRWYQDRTGWLLVGLGVAATGTGAGFLASASSLADRANGEPRESERMRLRDDSSSRLTIGAVTGGAGLALLGAGVIKLMLTPGASSGDESIRVTLAPRWIAIQGTF